MIRQGVSLRGVCFSNLPIQLRRSIYISSRGNSRRGPSTTTASLDNDSSSSSLLSQFEKLDFSLNTPSSTAQQNQSNYRARGRSRRRISATKQEQAEIDRKLVQIERFTNALRKEIEHKDEISVQQDKLKEVEKVNVNAPVDDKVLDDIMELMELPEGGKSTGVPTQSIENMKTSLFELPSENSKLPVLVTERLGSSTVAKYLAASNYQDWVGLVENINKETGLAGVTEEEFSRLVYAVPLDQRAQVLPLLHEMAWDANIPLSKRVYDNTMAGYAQRGDTKTVKAFLDQMQASGLQADSYSYGHLLKSLGKNHDLKSSVKVLRQMQSEGVPASLPLYTTLLQTCIKVNDFDQAFDVFDMLKFLGTDIHPDRAVYNSVIFAAAKTHNIERVLDLYREMTNKGILPDADTYSNLIYACARSERTHVRAWELLIEMYDKGIPPSRKTLNTMMYLCGATGELSFARAIFRQLCATPESYPDSFSFNCLLTAYANFKPGYFSPVLSTAVGPKLRAAFFYNMDIPSSVPAAITPPLLPYPMLSTVQQVLAESRAMFMFYKDMMNNNGGQQEVKLINDRTVYAYLTIPCKLNNEAEFRHRWTTETCVAAVTNPGDVNAGLDTRTPRNHHMYTLAISAYAQHGWTHSHAKGLWESRGEWRRNPDSVYRKSMSPSQRQSSDFIFAQRMAAYLAKVGMIEDAVDIVKSTAKQFCWRKGHVQPLLDVANEIEDDKSLRVLNGIVASYYYKA